MAPQRVKAGTPPATLDPTPPKSAVDWGPWTEPKGTPRKSAKVGRLTLDELMQKRWPNNSTATDWLKANDYDLDQLKCNIGLAPDQGVSLYQVDPARLARLGVAKPSATLPNGRGYNSNTCELRADLGAAYAATDRTCYLRLPKPGNKDAMQRLACFFAVALDTMIEVVDCETQEVVGRYHAGTPGSTNVTPPPTPAKPGAPKAARKTGAPKAAGERVTKRKVSYADMHKLASKKVGVTAKALNALNDNVPCGSWKGYLEVAVKQLGGILEVGKNPAGEVCYFVVASH